MSAPTKSHLYYVFLGRFAPLQLGHQLVIDSLVAKYGIAKVLLLIGSSDSYNIRTPYTFKERQAMIRSVYPSIRTAPLPDINSAQIHFDGSTNSLWLDSIQRLEKKMSAKFIFVGGSQADLSVLAERFLTVILIDRHLAGHHFSATQARQALADNDDQVLKTLLSPSVIPLAKSGYLRYQNSL